MLRRLSFVQSHPEMDDPVFPMGGPLLISDHHYTHIRLHAVRNQRGGRHVLLYLSLGELCVCVCVLIIIWLHDKG